MKKNFYFDLLQGFQPPLWLLLALLLTSIVYIVFVLDESMASCLGIPLCGKIRFVEICLVLPI